VSEGQSHVSAELVGVVNLPSEVVYLEPAISDQSVDTPRAQSFASLP